MPPNTVKVDRSTRWGNPFVPGQPAPFGSTEGEVVVDKFQAFLLFRAMAPSNVALIEAARSELAGRNLACWCAKPADGADTCHAAVLLALANGWEVRGI